MARKVILIGDPGIDTAFAVAVALFDPALDVLAVVPCAGNVSAARATTNVNILLDQFDPPKRPRTATALTIRYDTDAAALHGVDGLGGVNVPCVERHAGHAADRLIAELIRENPREVSVICLGPATTLAHCLGGNPDLAELLDKVVLVGGAWHEPGDVSPRAEFHFALDPVAARRLVHLGLHPLIVPLDVTRKLMLSPTELLDGPNPTSPICQFLKQIGASGLRANAQLHRVEGLYLEDLFGIVVLGLPGAIQFKPRVVDVETTGELTRGMLVVDDRAAPAGKPNALVGADVAVGEVRQYLTRVLSGAG